MKTRKPPQTSSTIRFTAELLRPAATEQPGSPTLITLPKNARAKLSLKRATMVEGTINGFPFRAALEPNSTGTHSLKITKALLDAVNADIGETVRIEITRIDDEPETRPPAELLEALATTPARTRDLGQHHSHCSPRLDSPDQFSQTRRNPPDPHQKSLLKARRRQAPSLLLPRPQMAHQRQPLRRILASAANR